MENGLGLMSEGDINEQMVMLMEVFIAGLALVFTVLSTYIVGLYFFLGRSGWGLRAWAFVLLTFVLGLISLFAYGAFRHYFGLIEATRELALAGENLSAVGRLSLEVTASELTRYVSACVCGLLASLYVSLFYFTFFHDWQRTHARNARGAAASSLAAEAGARRRAV